MKFIKFVSLSLFLLTLILPIKGQENLTVPKRTPEQEAVKQTEKLQQELNLNQEQANHIYEINLRYARERQISNKRSEALERMKNKNAEIKQILNPDQNERLQSKRYERTQPETNTFNSNQPVNSSTFRSSVNYRSNQPKPGQNSSAVRSRNNLRPVNPDFHPGIQPDQNKRRSTSTVLPSSTQFQHNPYSPRPSTGNPPASTRRTETVTPPRNNPPNTRQQNTPVYTPVKPNRK